MRISILHPSWKRPELALSCYNEWMGKAKSPQNIEYILCLAEKDPKLQQYLETFRETSALRIIAHENGLVKQVNHAAKEASGDLFVAVSDDFSCPDNWDEILLNACEGKSDFAVKTQDGLQPFIMTLPIMDRAFYNRLGHIYHPDYNHMYGDEELAEVSKMLNRTIVLPDYFRHNHYSTGALPKDEVNARNDSFMLIDKETYMRHRLNNFDIKILSILIPTIPKRKDMLDSLLAELKKQNDPRIEVIVNSDDDTIGAKRNALLQQAKGEYVCFIDDDDKIADHYIYSVLSALQSNPDCCNLNGVITTDGKNPKRFTHSIKYTSWYELDEVYYRPPNHLNVIKASIAKQFKFPGKNFGEDMDWSMQIQQSGLLKIEAYIDETLYYYIYKTNK